MAQIEPVIEREQSEDDAHVDRGVALEVVAPLALPEEAQRLPGTDPETPIRGKRDRHVQVEDPERRVSFRLRNPERTQQDAERQEEDSREDRVIP